MTCWYTSSVGGRVRMPDSINASSLLGEVCPVTGLNGPERCLGPGKPRVGWDYEDVSTGTYRAAVMEAKRLESCIFVGPQPELPSRSWLGSLFDRRELSDGERRGVLAARPPSPGLDAGAERLRVFQRGPSRHPAGHRAGLPGSGVDRTRNQGGERIADHVFPSCAGSLRSKRRQLPRSRCNCERGRVRSGRCPDSSAGRPARAHASSA
jgi:hypothetical protein